MTLVSRDASVHEQTVKDAATHAQRNRKRRRRSPSGYRSSAVAVAQVHPLVLAEARRLAGGDPSRLEVVDARTVIVR